MNDLEYIPIHRNVLIVAITGFDGWRAYVVPVHGINHDVECLRWPADGTKLPEAPARAFFPQFDEVRHAE